MLILLEDLGKDIETKASTQEWQYAKANFVGPFLKFTKVTKKSGDVYITFEKGIKVEDPKYMEKQDTKLNLVAKAIVEIVQDTPKGVIHVAVFGVFETFNSNVEEVVKRELSEIVLRRADIYGGPKGGS